MAWLKAHAQHADTYACLIWPFARLPNGYGSLRENKVHHTAHRYMCRLAHGEPESAELMATHTCGRGDAGCVNPKHLRWGTAKQNAEDSLAHGTRARGRVRPNCVLTEDQVREIRALRGTATHSAIGAMFGVSGKAVNSIYQKTAWAWLP